MKKLLTTCLLMGLLVFPAMPQDEGPPLPLPELASREFKKPLPQKPPGPPVPPEHFELITLEDEARFLDHLKTEDPERFEELSRLRAQDPEKFKEFIRRGIQDFRFLENIKRENPKLYEHIKKEKGLERKSMSLARTYRQTKETKKKEQIKKEMASIVDDLFDLRQSGMEMRLRDMKEELKKMEERIEKRKKNKETIVEHKILQMLGSDEGMEW